MFLQHFSLQQPFYVVPPYDHPWYLVHLVLLDFCCFATYSQLEPKHMPQMRQSEIHIIKLYHRIKYAFISSNPPLNSINNSGECVLEKSTYFLMQCLQFCIPHWPGYSFTADKKVYYCRYNWHKADHPTDTTLHRAKNCFFFHVPLNMYALFQIKVTDLNEI